MPDDRRQGMWMSGTGIRGYLGRIDRGSSCDSTLTMGRGDMDGGGGGLCFTRGLGSLDWMSSGDSARLKIHQSIRHESLLGANEEEIYEGGIPRVIVLGYDGLLIQPVAPPSPDYIPGPEDPQTQPVPQDEDEREPMLVQAHDPDYVPEPIYPEYIPLEDEHEFPAEEQPLPPIDSPTAESPGYVTESDPEEDPEEYEDDETEDGPVWTISWTCFPPEEHEPVISPLTLMTLLLGLGLPSGLRLPYPFHQRPTKGRGIDYGFVSTVDAEERRQGIRDVGYGIRDTWVDLTEAVPEISTFVHGRGLVYHGESYGLQRGDLLIRGLR
ncbi:hypothetical protein Tco_0700466 [Tanacetum coccineum]